MMKKVIITSLAILPILLGSSSEARSQTLNPAAFSGTPELVLPLNYLVADDKTKAYVPKSDGHYQSPTEEPDYKAEPGPYMKFGGYPTLRVTHNKTKKTFSLRFKEKGVAELKVGNKLYYGTYSEFQNSKDTLSIKCKVGSEDWDFTLKFYPSKCSSEAENLYTPTVEEIAISVPSGDEAVAEVLFEAIVSVLPQTTSKSDCAISVQSIGTETPEPVHGSGVLQTPNTSRSMILFTN